MEKLDVLRNKINEIDDQLIELLERRFLLSEQIGEVKAAFTVPVEDSNREHQSCIEQTYLTIFTQSKSLQRKL